MVRHNDTSPVTQSAPFLIGRGLSKTFGGVHALSGVDIDVRAGEIHGLVGANGAGKSTLIKILAGIEQPDGGSLSLDGRPIVIEAPVRATALGLSFIHQELHLVEQMDVLENITLGWPKPTRFGLVDWRRAEFHAAALSARSGFLRSEATISPMIETAISAGLTAPMSSPIGA